MHARFVSTLAAAVCIWALGGVPASAQFYEQHTLVSDGSVPADHVDPLLVNAWGLVSSPTSPWWVADNGSDSSTLYNGTTGAAVSLIVSVPGAPTGLVFNANSAAFMVNGSCCALHLRDRGRHDPRLERRDGRVDHRPVSRRHLQGPRD